MKFPGTEKAVPAFSHLLIALCLFASSSAALADAEADYQLGRESNRNGDFFGAMPPLKRAADAGHAAAQALYGSILDSADFDEDAEKFLLKAAAQNNADGQYGLAKLYFTGEAKEPREGEAARLMRAAAAQDHVLATVTLALAYTRKDARLGANDQNSPEAAQMLLKAAEFGEVQVMEILVNAYRTGAYGLPNDPAKADYWQARLAGIHGKTTKGARK